MFLLILIFYWYWYWYSKFKEKLQSLSNKTIPITCFGNCSSCCIIEFLFMLSLICVGACFFDFVDILRYTIMAIFSCLKNLTAYKEGKQRGERSRKEGERKEEGEERERAKWKKFHKLLIINICVEIYMHTCTCMYISMYLYTYVHICLYILFAYSWLKSHFGPCTFRGFLQLWNDITWNERDWVRRKCRGNAASVPRLCQLLFTTPSACLLTHIHPLRLPFIRWKQNTASFCSEEGREYDS